ncbi:pollen-specific leucine-rich repeat extensin-like protein 1 [Takifugu rubripes]|uniref:pollen-specific leucine-rich repeat extensin-like protein 1 n=1 Tax=Takifugu rubripes TaxID=31033 RepID=UPI001145FE12|nr:pollen-specific leucine-rich repeat extensin-like protein 1 [Takifugu rubripes]XP_029687684.1 pollen-specific leucine-rich repeat extensin-like protein 1 [Takifugu rubripes]
MESVCHEQHVMAEGGNSGDETKGMVWSKGTPQAEFPQMGRGVDIPGPVSELQPSKAPRDCPQPKTLPGLSAPPRVKPPRLQRRGRVSMGRRYQQREADKTKELDAERKPSPLPEIEEANFPSLSAVNVSTATVPATENKVGSKLSYAQVCRMPPRKRAPSPDLRPPYPDLRPPYSDLRPPYPDLRPPYSDLSPPYPDLRPPYPDLSPPFSDLSPPYSDLSSPDPDLSPPYPEQQPQAAETRRPKKWRY